MVQMIAEDANSVGPFWIMTYPRRKQSLLFFTHKNHVICEQWMDDISQRAFLLTEFAWHFASEKSNQTREKRTCINWIGPEQLNYVCENALKTLFIKGCQDGWERFQKWTMQLPYRVNYVKQLLKVLKYLSMKITWVNLLDPCRQKIYLHVICLHQPVSWHLGICSNGSFISPSRCFMGQAFKHSLLSSLTTLNTHGLFI